MSPPSRRGRHQRTADVPRRVQGMDGLDELEQVWRRDYMRRRAISEFLRDKVRRRRREPASPRRARPLAAQAPIAAAAAAGRSLSGASGSSACIRPVFDPCLTSI